MMNSSLVDENKNMDNAIPEPPMVNRPIHRPIDVGGEGPADICDSNTNTATDATGGTRPSTSSTNRSRILPRRCNSRRDWIRCDRVLLFALVIVIVGFGVSCAFVAFGLKAAKNQENVEFERRAQELISSVERAWADFEVAGLYVHNACRAKPNASASYLDGGICSRDEFDSLYETVVFSGLDIQAVAWAVNATYQDRLDLEAESYQYYADKKLTNFTYNGFIGFQPDPGSPRGVKVVPSPIKDNYYVVHYVAPYAGFNLKALDFDIQTSEPRRIAFENALRTRKPALTDRVVLLGDVAEVDGYSVIIMHPGNSQLQQTPNGSSLVVVRIRSLLLRATRSLASSSKVFMFDTRREEDPHFLGGLDIQVRSDKGKTETLFSFLPETDVQTIRSSDSLLVWEAVVIIADRQWTIVVMEENDLNILFVVIASVIIFTACLCLAGWYFTNARREERMHQMKAAAEAEKAALILENAEKNARHERELNDFVAHEVRNPLAAAMSAFSFVSTAINKQPPLTTEKAVTSVREDLSVIGSSLQYINDLLRNMIDMHKVASEELTAELVPTDIQRDLLDTVAAMLYNRGDNVEMMVECPENLAVMTDRIRLKQVLLNLTSNSRKFVIKGFIRIRVFIQDEKIFIAVEDSGPGIPQSKLDQLWNKYQESLDSLSQGTGIGLSLCKDLIHLMNGDIWLDQSYNSGIHGCPGARFVINLNAPPLELHSGTLDRYEDALSSSAIDGDGKKRSGHQYLENLPKQMRVLFVDDDMILRKLFGRTVKRILPGWDICEAANGETALEMAKSTEFDIIFVDQYMASIEKQLLGTETVRAMRANGVQSVVCGLSANDVAEAFLHAGANCFMFKPFPCEKYELAQELNRVLKGTDYLCNANADADADLEALLDV